MKCAIFASLRSQKEPFGGICDYVPTYFITEQRKSIICSKVVKYYVIRDVCTEIFYYGIWF